MKVSIQTTQSVTYWAKERLIGYAAETAASLGYVKFWSNLHGSQSNPIVTYYADADGNTNVDLTDYVRAYLPTVLYFADHEQPTPYAITLNIEDGINPEGVIIPNHTFNDLGALIIPPQMYYADALGAGAAMAEFYALEPQPGYDWYIIGGGATMAVSGRNITLSGGAWTLTDGNKLHRLFYNSREFDCDKTYALVRWVSFTGAIREHWFEVVKQKISIKNAFSLMPLDNEYIEIKGREDGITLKLDELSRYDYWYYADVANSSKVEVSLDGGVTYDRVQVTTKNVTIPDTDLFDGKLEIDVNWKRYDAVIL